MLIFSKEEITSLKSRYSFDDDENRLINNAIKNIWVNEKSFSEGSYSGKALSSVEDFKNL